MSITDWSPSPLVAVPDLDDRAETRLDLIEGIGGLRRVARVLGAVVVATVVIGLVGSLVAQASLIQSQRELDAQRRQIAQIEADTEAMRHQLAELEAPARIVAAARGLGMVDATNVTYLQIPGTPLEERSVVAAQNQLRVG